MSVRIQVLSTYPDKSTIVEVASDASFGDVKAAAAKALSLDLKEYSFATTTFGEDLSLITSPDEKTKLEIKDNFSFIAMAPAHLLPPRKRATEEKKEDVDEKFKDFTPENVFKKLVTTKGQQKKIALEYLDTYTSDILKAAIFPRLPKSALISVLKRDTLNAPEMEIFEAVLKWADSELKKDGKTSSSETRSAILKDVLPHIRFPIMTTEEVASKVSASGLLTSDQILALFTFLAQKDNPSAVPGPALSAFKFKPRSGGAAVKLAPSSDLYSDCGVFWYIGTGGGKKAFANPHTSGQIRMFTCDNPGWTSGWSESNLVDLVSTSRSLSSDYSMNSGTWFAVDLKDWRLCPTHYSMKNGGGRGLVLRDWSLEAKVKEGDSWTPIRRHTGDSTYGSDGLNGYGLHSFPIDPAPKEFYRFFRILRTDSSQAIYVHRWELFGQLKKAK